MLYSAYRYPVTNTSASVSRWATTSWLPSIGRSFCRRRGELTWCEWSFIVLLILCAPSGAINFHACHVANDNMAIFIDAQRNRNMRVPGPIIQSDNHCITSYDLQNPPRCRRGCEKCSLSALATSLFRYLMMSILRRISFRIFVPTSTSFIPHRCREIKISPNTKNLRST